MKKKLFTFTYKFLQPMVSFFVGGFSDFRLQLINASSSFSSKTLVFSNDIKQDYFQEVQQQKGGKVTCCHYTLLHLREKFLSSLTLFLSTEVCLEYWNEIPVERIQEHFLSTV